MDQLQIIESLWSIVHNHHLLGSSLILTVLKQSHPLEN
uniref:Uncharacterized protein n=1 Tax=viral metagenome TaxID=1070528 RepID=A0A6C0BN75_9ZZZZ